MGRVGDPYNLQLDASGGTPPYIWTQSGLALGLSLGMSTGVISGTPTTPGTYNFTVTLKDSAMPQGMDTAVLQITIQPGPLTISTNSLPEATAGQPYSFQLNATGGVQPYSWSATGFPSPITVSPSGLISGTPAAAGSFNVTVTVTDSQPATAMRSLTFTVTVPPLQITTSELPPGSLSQPYNFQLTAVGGTPPRTWSAAGLPAGLSMTTAGIITGTPTTAGVFNVTAQVMDSAMSTASRSYTLPIDPGPPRITTTSLPPGTVGQPYSQQMLATAGSPPYAWSATGLPAGLLISTSGLIGGTPTAAGTFNLSVTVTDSEAASDTDPFSLTIQPAPAVLSITTTTLPNGTRTESYTAQVNATAGSPPYTFSFGIGTPPPGLEISPTGNITGTPTASGTFTFNVNVVDNEGAQATKQFIVTIGEPLQFLSEAQLPPAIAGQAYVTAIQAQGGVPPYSFSLTGPGPAGFRLTLDGLLSGTPAAPGALRFPIQVADQLGKTARRDFDLAVAAAGAPFQTSVSEISFSAAMGGDAPPSQSVAITAADGQQRAYAITLDSVSAAGLRAAAPPWLRVDPADGTIPTRVTVTPDPSGLSPGRYAARMTVSAPNNAALQPAVVGVSLTVANQGPQLEAPTSPLEFVAHIDEPGRQSQFVSLRNRGGGGPIDFTAAVVGRSPWIRSVSPAAGQTSPGAAVHVDVQIDTTGLAVGRYRDAIRFTTSGGTVEVPVVAFVSAPGAQLDLSVEGVRFRIREGNTISTQRLVDVINRGAQGTAVRWTATIVRGEEFLDIPVNTGIAVPGDPATLAVRLKPAAAALPAGASYGLIRVADPAAQHSPKYVTVVVEVASAAAPALLDFDSAGAVLVAAPGSPQPRTAAFLIGASSQAPVPFQAVASPVTGDGWLSVSPASGMVSSMASVPVTVTARATNLTAGVYRGEVVLARGAAVVSLNVTFIVAEAVVPPAARSAGRAAGCEPGQLALTHSGLPNNFSVPAGWPATLIVQLHDNCGRAVTSAAMTASFSNGDPVVSLEGDGTGVFSAVWQPVTAMNQVNITVRASAAGFAPASALLIGGVAPNTVPTLARGGTVHNLKPGGALSPGVIAQVFGSAMAAGTGSTGAAPLATNFQGTSVIIGDQRVPLYYVSPGQLVVQVPTELRNVNQHYPVIVAANDVLTVPDRVWVAPLEPGVAAFPDGALIAQHADFSLVTPENPARRGEFLVMYLVGLGATTPPVPSGAPSPLSPLAVPVVSPSLSIDGQPAQIVFAGLTPGFAGLFQINFQVPADARLGEPLDVVVRQGDAASNVTKLTVAR
jgi:uncharacterized protein (TIGR03437 family)